MSDAVFSNRYRRYALGVLTVVLTMSFFDRGLIVLLLQPIKEDLSLSDTQLGFLTGIAFGLFYALLGLPIARWADRGNRVAITSIAIGLWGLTVMSCLFVMSFVQLVCARVASAVGEAGCMPPTYSLLGDYFSGAAERARAMAIYWLGSPLSQLIGFGVGSWLYGHLGWRMTFVVMGIPALLLAVLVKSTLREPRANAQRHRDINERMPSMSEVLASLWHRRSTRHLGIATILTLTLSLGLYPWYAAFMVRSHGMAIAELGIWFALIFGFGGIAGTLLGGYVASHWFADNERSQLRLSAVMTGLLAPCFALFLLLPRPHQALMALLPLLVVFYFFLAPTFALLQRLVSEDMRATSLAVIMLLANLIGMGLGPQIVGFLSDRWLPIFGADSLRYAMLTMSSLALWAAFHFWRAGGKVKEDLAESGVRGALPNASHLRALDARDPCRGGMSRELP